MKGFKCFLICFFLLEAQAFEIPTDELSEFAEYGDLLEPAPGKFQFVPDNRRYQRSLPGESGEVREDVDQVTLYSYKVQSTITSRVANTMIQSKLVNNSPQPQNVVFDVEIPKGAFISNFSMSLWSISHSIPWSYFRPFLPVTVPHTLYDLDNFEECQSRTS